MRSFFIGHGSPMNALRENAYAGFLRGLGRSIRKPRCVIVFSAHWLTGGSYITGGPRPGQIYDFSGFPDELYRLAYRPPGLPSIAEAIHAGVPEIGIDHERGIDHAAWAVAKHMFPEADVPLLEISLNVEATEAEHFSLGERIAGLSLDDALFVGSGNLVHNLREADFDDEAEPYPWAVEADAWLAGRVAEGDVRGLLRAEAEMPHYGRAVPTNDHFLPMLYVLGFFRNDLRIEYEEIQNGSVSMLGFSAG